MPTKRKFDPNRVPPFFCSMEFAAKSYGVTTQTIFNWKKEGCPTNDDGTLSLPDVYRWNITHIKTKMVGSDVDTRRKQKDIELKEAQIQKIRGNLIEKSLMETIMSSRAGNLNRFLTKTFVNQAPYFVGKTTEEVRTALYDMVQKAMDAYIGDTDVPHKMAP
jgi:hypothetical protein